MWARGLIIVAIVILGSPAVSALAAGSITGCLRSPGGAVFVVHRLQGPHRVQITGSEDLGKHVGHMVRLTGEWVGSGAARGRRGLAPTNHFKASAVEHLSAECPNP